MDARPSHADAKPSASYRDKSGICNLWPTTRNLVSKGIACTYLTKVQLCPQILRLFRLRLRREFAILLPVNALIVFLQLRGLFQVGWLDPRLPRKRGL